MKIEPASKMIKRDYMPWFVWSIVGAFVFYQFLLQSSMSVLQPSLKSTYNITPVHFSIVSSIYFYTYLSLQIPAGMLVDRYGVRRVLLYAIALFSAAVFYFSVAETVFGLEISRLLMGAAASPAIASALYLGGRWFAIHRFALIAGLTEMMCMLGGWFSQDFLSFSIDVVGWRQTMVICSFLGICLWLFVWIFVLDRPPSDLEPANKIHEPILHTPLSGKFSEILRNPKIWAASLISGALFSVITAFSSVWAVAFLIERYDVSLQSAGLVNSLIFLGAAIGTPFFGWYAEKKQYHRRLLLLGCFSQIILLTMIIYIPHIAFITSAILFLLLGFIAGTYVIPFAMVNRMVSPDLKGTAMGFVNFFCVLIGAPILQTLIGYIYQMESTVIVHHEGEVCVLGFKLAFLSLLVVLALGMFLVRYTRPAKKNILDTSEAMGMN